MARNGKHLIHVKSGSTVTSNGVTSAKLPTYEDVELGELAVNYAKGYETISMKNSNNEIVPFASKEYVDTQASQAASVKEVQVGGTAPTGTNTIDVFIDTSVDPVTVDVYNKSQIDTKVTALENADTATNDKLDDMIIIGSTTPSSNDTELFVDTSADTGIEVYTKAQVDAIIAQLKEDNHLI